MIIEAYCPLVRNEKVKDPTLIDLAKKYGKTQAQVLIRWALQKGWVPLPKSITPSRVIENADVYGWELSEQDMRSLNALDEGRKGSIVEFAVEE